MEWQGKLSLRPNKTTSVEGRVVVVQHLVLCSLPHPTDGGGPCSLLSMWDETAGLPCCGRWAGAAGVGAGCVWTRGAEAHCVPVWPPRVVVVVVGGSCAGPQPAVRKATREHGRSTGCCFSGKSKCLPAVWCFADRSDLPQFGPTGMGCFTLNIRTWTRQAGTQAQGGAWRRCSAVCAPDGAERCAT